MGPTHLYHQAYHTALILRLLSIFKMCLGHYMTFMCSFAEKPIKIKHWQEAVTVIAYRESLYQQSFQVCSMNPLGLNTTNVDICT